MTAEEFLKAGHLSAAVEQLNHEVRSRPTDSQRRTFLFELLCFAGDCQRAERQLDVLGQQSATAEIGVEVYHHILTAEQTRHRLFSEGVQPDFLFPPPSYVSLHLEALHRLCNQQPAEAVALLEQSQRSQPPLRGSLEGQPFTEWRDGDDLLAPFLAVTMALLSISVIPFGSQVNVFGYTTWMQLADLNVGVLFILAVSSMGVYGIALAGWSSNNKYSLLGGLRSSAQLISYELPLSLAVAPKRPSGLYVARYK